MPTIHQLPPSVVNKIAAGEVIERPASVVKELLENAVDSGASRIDVSVQQGGTASIRVADNGCGMGAEDLPLAVTSHATSKIRDADDLFRVATLGFRGEALASIAEVSQFCLRSRTAAAEAGCELEVRGGQFGEVRPCGCPPGTIVEVRNLFHNTPVRRKFMRTTQTEMGHVSEAFTRLALANPHIHLTLQHGDRNLYDLPAVDSWRERIASFFGGEINENLIWVESGGDALQLSGYVADPQISRSNNRMQYLFLNGRFIRDRSLQHALSEAYRGLLMTGRFPVAFLRLGMPADMIDVNVHPTKLEVRFQDGGRLYSQLLGTLRNKFLSSDLTTRAQPPAQPERAGQPAGIAAVQLEQHRQQFSAWAQGAGGSAGAAGPAARSQSAAVSPPAGPPAVSTGATARTHQEELPLREPSWKGQRLDAFRPFPGDARSEAARPQPAQSAVEKPALEQPAAPSPIDRGATAESNRRPLGLQLHNRYLVTENDEGMVVIDQHALHERILYEQIREKVLSGRLEAQRLLVPEPVSLTAAEAAAALEARDTLAQLGMEIEPFGGDTVLISTYPAMLASIAPRDVLRQVVDLLLAEAKTPERRDVLDELLHLLSCKAAIKAGDRLAAEEIDALLEQRQHYQDAHHCPHGRPTSLVFSRSELDKRFKRI